MALFGRNKKADAPETTAPAATRAATRSSKTDRDLSRVIIRPRLTEKAVAASERQVYVFDVAMNATKYDIAAAVKAAYKVTPTAVRIVRKQPRNDFSRTRGRHLHQPGSKKAYVTLKAGETISIV